MSEPRLKMLYDGLCPLCKREVRIIERHDKHDRIQPVDITTSDFDPQAYGLTRAAVHARMHAILPDGKVVTGMEAFRRIYDAMGLGWLWKWTGWPILRPIFDLLYAGFAKVRPRFQQVTGGCEGDACSISPRSDGSP